MNKFAEKVRETPSCREPAYRPAMYMSEEEKKSLDEKIGDANLYADLVTMREMVSAAPGECTVESTRWPVSAAIIAV